VLSQVPKSEGPGAPAHLWLVGPGPPANPAHVQSETGRISKLEAQTKGRSRKVAALAICTAQIYLQKRRPAGAG
jgi:hypothetical protein